MLWWPVAELEAGRCVRLGQITIASEAQSEAQSCAGCLLFQEAFSEDFLFWEHILKTSAAALVA